MATTRATDTARLSSMLSEVDGFTASDDLANPGLRAIQLHSDNQ